MRKMTKLLSCLLLATIISGCATCRPDKASKALRSSLPFHKMQIELVKENRDECSYIFMVKAKEFKEPAYFIVTREHKKWTHRTMQK